MPTRRSGPPRGSEIPLPARRPAGTAGTGRDAPAGPRCPPETPRERERLVPRSPAAAGSVCPWPRMSAPREASTRNRPGLEESRSHDDVGSRRVAGGYTRRSGPGWPIVRSRPEEPTRCARDRRRTSIWSRSSKETCGRRRSLPADCDSSRGAVPRDSSRCVGLLAGPHLDTLEQFRVLGQLALLLLYHLRAARLSEDRARGPSEDSRSAALSWRRMSRYSAREVNIR